MAADLSVIIINYNTPELTAGTVESLFATREKIGLEIVVIDNASTRGNLRSTLAPWQKRAKESSGEVALQVHVSEKNLGFTGGNNLGLKHATAPVLLMLNSDTRVRPGCLKACLDYLAAHPEAGILGPKLLDPEGTRQLSCRRFPSFRTALFNRYSLLTRLFPRNPWSRDYLMNEPEESDEPRVVDWVSGAAMFITRQAFEEVGPLDETFFMYAEDVDYCLRAHRANYEVHFFPRAEIEHLIGGSSRTLPFKTIWWRHRSMWLFYYKHYSRRIAFFDLITLGGITARALLKIADTGIVRLLKPSPGKGGPAS